MSTDALIDGLWGDAPPDSAPNVLQAYVSRLRKVVNRNNNGLRLERRPPGYVLTVEPGLMDLQRFVAPSSPVTASTVQDVSGATDPWAGWLYCVDVKRTEHPARTS